MSAGPIGRPSPCLGGLLTKSKPPLRVCPTNAISRHVRSFAQPPHDRYRVLNQMRQVLHSGAQPAFYAIRHAVPGAAFESLQRRGRAHLANAADDNPQRARN